MHRIALLFILTVCLSLAITADSEVVFPTDGWQTDDPAAYGFDTDMLAEMDMFIDDTMPALDSLLIVRDGMIVYERYFDGGDETTLREMFSVTKSVTSALTGIALENGDLDSIDVPVLDFFPDYITDDELKTRLTLEHLLQMKSGLVWNDLFFAGQLLDGELVSEDILDQMALFEPGTQFNYSTGNSQVISSILETATGVSLAAYAETVLFEPLGIENYVWGQDGEGVYFGGVGLQLTARDMAKFGYLYLHDGMWDNEQIVPQDWVDISTAAGTSTDDYGYHWWIETYGDYTVVEAQGFGGQKIHIFEDLDMLVITQATPSFEDDTTRDIRRLIRDYILPAVTGQ
ncbi:MAG: serine hydrolase domain-containing protein [Aggregatilineales bacterium]